MTTNNPFSPFGGKKSIRRLCSARESQGKKSQNINGDLTPMLSNKPPRCHVKNLCVLTPLRDNLRQNLNPFRAYFTRIIQGSVSTVRYLSTRHKKRISSLFFFLRCTSLIVSHSLLCFEAEPFFFSFDLSSSDVIHFRILISDPGEYNQSPFVERFRGSM